MKNSLPCLLIVLAGLYGCDPERAQERGFRLPHGDAVAGREAFTYMQCNQCHTVSGDSLPTVAGYEPYVMLGGRVSRVKTYGELVTSIINPSHRLAEGYPEELVSEDGESNMYVYNDYMTVRELSDLVTYLQEHYDVVPPNFEYRIYP